MIDKLYNATNLDKEETQYKIYFEQLVTEFGAENEIFIRKEDFNRMLAAGIVNRHSQVAVTIYLKYGCIDIPNPLNLTVIETARNHLISSTSTDLKLNCPN
ncbi:MAG: hypothetical protein VKN72_12535 [Nostocales cyanobacterium 94392]|nr:hypothetical protein [Nostocales cyanobacterium 94392]